MPGGSHRNRFNLAKKTFALEYGESVALYSVDYTAQDQEPTFTKNAMYFVEPEGPQFAQPGLPNGTYYCVHGDFFSVPPGTLVVPTEALTSSPTLTVLSRAFLGEIVGFRTNRIGAIYNGETLIYENIRWDLAPTTYTANFPLSKEFKASPDVPILRANMFSRVLRTVGDEAFDTEGLLFVETDVTPNVYWKIKQATTAGDITQLDLELNRYE